jgi:predicted negative regulator of RcsB-dependent stress response
MVLIRKKIKETAEEKEAKKLKEQEAKAGIQDEYQAKGFELVYWVQHNKGLVTSLIVALFLGGAVFGGYLYFQARKAEAASLSYMDVLSELEKEKNTADAKAKALASLMNVASSHKNSGVATLANLRAAELALSTNQALQAVTLYSDVLKSLKANDSLTPLVLMGLGYAYEQNNQGAQALEQFEKVVATKDAVGRDLALWEASRIAKNLNDTEKSEKFLSTLRADYPSSPYDPSAKAKKFGQGISY